MKITYMDLFMYIYTVINNLKIEYTQEDLLYLDKCKLKQSLRPKREKIKPVVIEKEILIPITKFKTEKSINKRTEKRFQKFKGRYGVYYTRCLKKNREFNINEEDFYAMIELPCTYCGGKSSGIDRIKSCLGYIEENMTPCCAMCNTMKYVYSVENFLKHVSFIYEFNK